jgi:hypothetical protein
MRLHVEEISLTGITREQARQIRNELLTATNGNLELYPDQYPALNELYKLITGTFESSQHGIHYISKR